jgi:hypothetical protein
MGSLLSLNFNYLQILAVSIPVQTWLKNGIPLLPRMSALGQKRTLETEPVPASSRPEAGAPAALA